MTRQATLFLMCGLPGAGKTTRAMQLEQRHSALRLSTDEWMLPLFGPHLGGAGDTEDRRTLLERVLLWNVTARVLTLGLDVILDFGFWSRAEREEYRARARALGARVRVIFLDVPRAELWRRLEERNQALPSNTFSVSPAELDLWCSWFEAPTASELALE